MFAQKVYRESPRPIWKGLEQYVAKGGDPSHVASVASFFVSRIDSAVDKQLDEKIAKANDPSEKERLAALKGKVAIANAKLAYQDYKRLFSGARWDKLNAKGAKPQRLLWASTGTKNKEYSDVLYVEELIGPNTINTVPPATLDAFRDHGKPRDSLEENIEDARHVLEELEKSGVSLDAITAELVKDGVKQFADAADKLYGAVAHKRAASLGGGIDHQKLALGSSIAKAVEKSTEEWRASAKIRNLWHKDKSVWTGDDENKWLGWLDSAAAADVADYEDFAQRVKGQKFSDAVVLGMGGSSLGPEVLARNLCRKSQASRSSTCSTPPILRRSARWRRDRIDKALFIVSSKSGGTTEPNAMKDYFFERVSRRSAPTRPAIASSRSPIPARRWRRSRPSRALRASSMAIPLSADATPCCRRSAWCRRPPPASTSRRLIRHTLAMVRSCGADVPPHENPGVQLGLAHRALPASKAATRSRSCRRRRSPISAPGPSS